MGLRKELLMKSVPLFPVAIGLSNFGKSNHDLNVALINDIFAEYDEDRKRSSWCWTW